MRLAADKAIVGTKKTSSAIRLTSAVAGSSSTLIIARQVSASLWTEGAPGFTFQPVAVPGPPHLAESKTWQPGSTVASPTLSNSTPSLQCRAPARRDAFQKALPCSVANLESPL